MYIVNAFTAQGKNGNPAGVVFDADDLSDDAMQDIAAQAGISETAFVSQSQTADRRVRFFTPTTEVDLCGHATIATWSLMHELGMIEAGHYTQETTAGLLRVRVHQNGLIFMEQNPAAFYDVIFASEVAPLLGLTADDFHATLQPQIVSTGIRDLIVPLKDKSLLAQLKPDLDAIAEFSRQHDISGLHVFALLEDGQESLAAARNFAPADGIPEECATGTSNGALLCYLQKYDMLPALPDDGAYRIEQGETMGCLSYIYGTFKEGVVWIGGHATTAQ